MNVGAAIVCAWGICAGMDQYAVSLQSPSSSAEFSGSTVRSSTGAAASVAVSIQMRRVRLHLTPGIALDVRNLDGLMVSRNPGGPPVFDDARSYLLQVDAADMLLDMSSLTNLLNEHVFAYEGAPLRNVSVGVASDGRLAIKGKLHKGISLPFSMRATVAATSDGRLRLHVDSAKAAGVPVKGLMHLVGLEVEDVMDLKTRRDISLEGDDMFVSPGTALPPPEIRGRLTKAVTVGQQMKLTFGDPDRHRQPLPHGVSAARNFVYFAGGTIRFGKLTMAQADLQLIDADPRDPFDFFPARYQRQLVAGYSKNTPAGGLRTFMPDYDDLNHRRETDLRPRRGSRMGPRQRHAARTAS
jgi:hypothetical protein